MQVTSYSGEILEFDEASETPSDKRFCPLSGTKGKRVLRKTLANHLHPRYWHLINNREFFFCPTTQCPTIYYDNQDNIVLSDKEVIGIVGHKVPIGSEIRPICYCKNVLESTIIEELTIKQCCDSIIDIQEFTEANTGKDCAITNPSGRCCGSDIREILEWVKDDGYEVSPELIDEAMSCCNRIEEVTPDE